MIAPYKIKFRGKTNLDFDLICHESFESDHGNTESFLSKESMSSNMYNGVRKNVHGYRYTDVINVSFTLIKSDYSDIEDIEFRRISAWITGSNQVEELAVYKDDSEVISYRLLGGFTNIEHYKMGNGRNVGVIATFENISPYAFSPVKTVTADPIEIINCNTDAYENFLYPKITVTIGKPNEDGVMCIPITEDPMADGYEMMDNTVYQYENHYYTKVNEQKQTLSGVFSANIDKQTPDSTTYNKYYLCNADHYIYKGIINENSSYAWERYNKIGAGFEIKNTYYENGRDITVSTIVTDNHQNEIITIDGDNRVISSSDTPMRIIGDSFNWEWLYFVPGENTITVAGNCTAVFQWVEPIKIGQM